MLQSLRKLTGKKLAALDGEIGQVKDVYFDDHTRTVRYIVADTGTWLTSRLVLLSPRAFGGLHHDAKTLSVNLTKKQIADSPPIESHKPVSRQYEEEYHRHFGWPYYWEGDGLGGGIPGFPVLESSPTSPPAGSPAASGPKAERVDAHLHSVQAVNGYHLQAADGITGHVCDFLMDPKTWAIQQVVIKVGHRLTGKEVQIPMSQVERISYTESTVFTKLTREAVEKSPEFEPGPTPVTALVMPVHGPVNADVSRN